MVETKGRWYINNSVHLAWKYARIFVLIICSEKRTMNFEEQIMSKDKMISKHIFKVKWRLLCLLSFRYFSQHSQFWKFGNFLGCSQVWAGEHPGEHIRSCDAFRPIEHERTYLMDYKDDIRNNYSTSARWIWDDR